MYSKFVFLDRFFSSYRAKTHTHTHTHKHTHTHRDSNEYPIVAFSKNATIIIQFNIIQNTELNNPNIMIIMIHKVLPKENISYSEIPFFL